MIRRTLSLLALAALSAGCYSDNASPIVHGAHNKPSATAGKTYVGGKPSTMRDQVPKPPSADVHYAQSGGTAGGQQVPGQ